MQSLYVYNRYKTGGFREKGTDNVLHHAKGPKFIITLFLGAKSAKEHSDITRWNITDKGRANLSSNYRN